MKTKLENVSQAELENFNKDFQEVITKNNVEIRIVPTFIPTTEGKFVVDCQMMVYKKVEVKEEGVESPFIEKNGEENTTTPKTD